MLIEYQKQLQTFGLSEKEALVYELLLRLGTTPASQLATEAKLNRSTTYVQLQSLMNIGLVTSLKIGKKTMFTAESPENLEILLNNQISELKKQKKQINELLPNLAQAFIVHSVTPVIRHFQGKDGLAAMRNEVFTSKDDKIRMVMNFDDLQRIFSKEEREVYDNRRKQQTIESFIIYSLESGSDLIPFYYQNLKRIKSSDALFGCDIYIYGNTVSFAAMKQEVVGVSIDQKDIADAMKQLFDTYWDFHPAVR